MSNHLNETILMIKNNNLKDKYKLAAKCSKMVYGEKHTSNRFV